MTYFLVCGYEAGPCIYRDTAHLGERCVAHGAPWDYGVHAESRDDARSQVGRPFKALRRPDRTALFGKVTP